MYTGILIRWQFGPYQDVALDYVALGCNWVAVGVPFVVPIMLGLGQSHQTARRGYSNLLARVFDAKRVAALAGGSSRRRPQSRLDAVKSDR